MSQDQDNKPPARHPVRHSGPPTPRSSAGEVAAFVEKLRAAPGTRGRLMVAIDATASREPTWDLACQIQGEMFRATAALGGLEVQLVFYRGFDECLASPWVTRAEDLVRRMAEVRCLGGQTQIGRVLRHALTEAEKGAEKGPEKGTVRALVFIGDAMEEDIDALSARAGELGLRGVPVFVFHEGFDPVAERAFRQIATLSGGAYCRFDAGSADQLKALLGAVAAFAAGGTDALENYSRRAGEGARLLADQMRRLPGRRG